MNFCGKATERLEKIYKKPVSYYYLTNTRTAPITTMHTVQAVLGQWRDIGIGNSYEDAREAAAEIIINKLEEQKASKSGRGVDSKIMVNNLKRELKTTKLIAKELGVQRLEDILKKIDNAPTPFGSWESVEFIEETTEVLSRFGYTLLTEEHTGTHEHVVVYTVITSEIGSKVVVEFGSESQFTVDDIKINGLKRVIVNEKLALESEIKDEIKSDVAERERQYRSKTLFKPKKATRINQK